MGEAMDEVVGMLQMLDVDQLIGICESFKIVIPKNKAGKKRSIFNLILVYLASDDLEEMADQGKAILEKLAAELQKITNNEDKTDDDDKSAVKKLPDLEDTATKDDNKDDACANSSTGSSVQVRFSKLREFKITGGSVGAEDGCVDFETVWFQIQEGKALGYSMKEITSGVIKAIKSGSSLRRYFQSQPNLTETNFMKILRSTYGIEDSSTYFNKMANAAQEPTETEMNFVLRLMDLRNKVITLSKDEECPFEEKMVGKKFLHSVGVGFRKDTVRLTMENVTKNTALTDEALLREVSIVVAREKENRAKTKTGKNASSNALNTVEMEEKTRETDDPVLKELRKLTAQVSNLTTKQTDMEKKLEEVKYRQVDVFGADYQPQDNSGRGGYNRGGGGYNRGGSGYNRGRGGYNGGRRWFVKCDPCEKSGEFCRHCLNCGSTEHKRMDCTVQKNV